MKPKAEAAWNKTQVSPKGPRRHGLVVRAVICEARGPGLDSSSDQMFFLFSSQEKQFDPEMTNCVILGIHVDKKKEKIPSHAIQQQTSVRARYGSKKSKSQGSEFMSLESLRKGLKKIRMIKRIQKNRSVSLDFA